MVTKLGRGGVIYHVWSFQRVLTRPGLCELRPQLVINTFCLLYFSDHKKHSPNLHVLPPVPGTAHGARTNQWNIGRCATYIAHFSSRLTWPWQALTTGWGTSSGFCRHLASTDEVTSRLVSQFPVVPFLRSLTWLTTLSLALALTHTANELSTSFSENAAGGISRTAKQQVGAVKAGGPSYYSYTCSELGNVWQSLAE